MKRINLGQKAMDRITGFTGMVTGRAEYISGCEQLLVQPPVKSDGTFVDPHWIDIDRLVVVEEKPVQLEVSKPGLDVPAPVR